MLTSTNSSGAAVRASFPCNWWQALIILSIVMAAGGWIAVNMGFSPDWDFFNYHFYNPHALLTGRHAIDSAPAQLQTFLNPALHFPFYLVFQQFGTNALLFLTGALQATQLVLLWFILVELTGNLVPSRWFLLPIAALGLGGPIFMNQLGGSQGDTLLSIPVLGALLILVRAHGRAEPTVGLKTGFWAGLLLGLACALKLTMAIYAVAIGLSCLVCFNPGQRWRLVLGLLIGGASGFVLAGGAWFVRSWMLYGNPFLPYFNNIFDSPWVPARSFRDTRFLPETAAQWWFYPWYWWQDYRLVWEVPFRDVRMPLLITAVFVLPGLAWHRARERSPALCLVWLVIAISYLLWLGMFSIYRYLSVIELLAPATIFVSGLVLLRSGAMRLAVSAALVVFLVFSQFRVEYHRNQELPEFQPGVASSLQNLPSDSMLIMGGFEPMAYVALWVPDHVPIIRIRSNFMNHWPPDGLMHRQALDRVNAHPGLLFFLWRESEQGLADAADDLNRIGVLPSKQEKCNVVFDEPALQNRTKLLLCPLKRAVPFAQLPGL